MKLKEWHKTALVILMYLAGIGMNMYSGRVLIPTLFPERPVLPDIILTNIPYIQSGKYLMEAAPVILTILFLVLLVRNRFMDFNRYVFALAMLLILRSITIVLNPVGHSWTGFENRLPELLANPTSDVYGFFFSGHTANTVLLTLIIGRINRKWLYFSIFVTATGLMGMLLSRNHYSMDVYGGVVTALLVAYLTGIISNRREVSELSQLT